MLPSPPHLTVAFTSNSLTWVDVDFVRARQLVIYEISPTTSDFIDSIEFAPPRLAGSAGRSGCPDAAEAPALAGTAAARLEYLHGVGLLFTAGLSDQTAMRLARTGTFPVAVERRRAILDIIDRMQILMRRDPPLWLCRLLRYGHRPLSRPLPRTACHDCL
jgi:nitrogen fixation protein NifX